MENGVSYKYSGVVCIAMLNIHDSNYLYGRVAREFYSKPAEGGCEGSASDNAHPN